MEASNIHRDDEQRLADGNVAGNLPAPVRAALAQFAKARDYARDVQCDPWEFAIEIARLTSIGVTASDLRWLVKKGYIEHACEITRPGDAARRFQRRPNLAFTGETCFLLTDAALALAEKMAAIASKGVTLPGIADGSAKSTTSARVSVSEPAGPPAPTQSPRWDADDRTLYVGNLVVKEYRVRSPNQEAVLAAFQEEDWPHYIDDPLSPVPDQSPKQRLRDTVKRLNENQRSRLVRFRGDGTGERVRWELIQG